MTLSARRIAELLDLREPTDEQVAVIEAPLEPVLVVAGAGSGKTETMSGRVVWLVANGHVRPEEVLGLTFTRKAAGELADRVRARLVALHRAGVRPPGQEPADDPDDVAAVLADPTVATYHSYAAGVVADHGLRLGVEPGSRLLGEAAAWQLATEVVEAWDGPQDGSPAPDKAPGTVVDAVLSLAAECAEHLVEPEEVADYLTAVLERVPALPKSDVGDPPAAPYAPVAAVLRTLRDRRAVVPLVRDYLERKRELEVLDFGDQVRLAAQIARDVPDVGAGERARFRVVLLDEYQDTSHAQLELLRHLFGGGHPVTAVGDPHQSIYGWRGASAGNLAAFPAHFPAAPGRPAAVLPLTTAWRNDQAVLASANAVSAPLREASTVEVLPLAPRRTAGAGEVRTRYHTTVEEEAAAVAEDLAALWRQDTEIVARGGVRRSMAVLCRKRSQFEALEAALRAEDLPVEVVGLGGLLSRPEVVDLVAALQVVHDPHRGDALMRLLTGPGWQIGPRDLETLAQLARGLAAQVPGVPQEAAEDRSVVEALDTLPPPGWVGRHGRGFSAEGRARLSRLAAVLRQLRGRTGLPLPDLVAEAERALLLDVEVAARPGVAPGAARAHLDAFADVAASFADGADRPTLGAFLAWLEAADTRERGLQPGETDAEPVDAPGDVEPSRTAVQLLTVHAAKGLEWDVVAVPGMSEGTFPAVRVTPGAAAPDASGGWLTGLGVLPYDLRGDGAALPRWPWRSAATQRALRDELTRFRQDCGAHDVAEERRLAYVAITRARSLLLLSGAWWADGTTARPPSRFLLELGLGGDLDPPEGDNPRLAEPLSAVWPTDPLGPRREQLEAAAAAVHAALVRPATADEPTGATPDRRSRWAQEVDRLLEEREALHRPGPAGVPLPTHLSASRLVELAADPAALAAAIRRPMPVEPRPQTRRGTAFHAWLERRFAAGTLVDVLELPGAGDDDAAPDAELAALQATFEASPWAERMPVAVEVDVETPVGGTVVRGRIDAVFTTADGGWEVVDWKTGSPPTGQRRHAAAVQLAVYRLAWARLQDVPLERVSAAFFYASTGETVRPADPLDEAALEALVLDLPDAAAG